MHDSQHGKGKVVDVDERNMWCQADQMILPFSFKLSKFNNCTQRKFIVMKISGE